MKKENGKCQVQYRDNLQQTKCQLIHGSIYPTLRGISTEKDKFQLRKMPALTTAHSYLFRVLCRRPASGRWSHCPACLCGLSDAALPVAPGVSYPPGVYRED